MADDTPRRLDDAERRRIAAVIDRNMEQLSGIQGFLDAEPGFLIADGWIRREPAIVVHVKRKLPRTELLDEELAPRSLEGVRVDVVGADPWRLLASDPEMADLAGEGDGAALADLTYERRDGNPIDAAVQVGRPILCHAGPDAGWPVLKEFLEGVQKTLTAAMYDLNAPYIARILIDVVRGTGASFTLTWDSGMTPDETELRTRLKDKLAGQLDAWVVRTGGGWRFDSAYHEKVAIKDSESFWLSSGNWSKRSQPDIDPVGTPAEARGMYSKGNREWHVVVDDAPLAKTFEDYILYDREQSEEEDTALAPDPPTSLPDLFVPIEDVGADEDLALAAPNPVAPARLPTHGRAFAVQPVLCPDNYIGRITELVESARNSLYLQYAYITWSDAPRDAAFTGMLTSIAELSHRDGFDLRIIVGNTGAEDKVRKLVEAGFNEERIRVQSSIHNKGVVVDGRAVLVSSANWSSAGALRNRDAGVIIHDPEVAGYFQAIFLDDWNQRAKADFGRPRPVALAAAGEPTPPGMARVGWRDYVGD